MLLFALALHPLIKELHASFERWYADDGTIAVPIPIARQVIDFLVTKGAPRGFSINLRKTRAWWPSLLPPISQELRSLPCTIRRDDSVEVLGAPIGSANGCSLAILRRVDK